jgi:transcriptional regulator with XRE-family HTH domain
MSTRRLQNYLRTHRKRAGLSQMETAFLLGVKSGTKISRYENLARIPDLATVFALEAIYRVPARELFAGMFDDVQRAVRARARRLAKRMSKNSSASTNKLNSVKAVASGRES